MAKKKLSAKEHMDLLKEKAARLAEVRSLIGTREEAFKKETDDLYSEEKALREEILLGLKGVGLNSIRTDAGESYAITRTQDFVPTNPIAYEQWARDNRCVRVDARIAKQRLRDLFKKGEVPSFIEVQERETISIRSPKKETPDE